MIIKSFELKKINLEKNNFILLYGKNEGFKNQVIDSLKNNHYSISNYEEKEILENKENFLENILSKSLFGDEKLIIIKRASDKILELINKLDTKNSEDKLIIIADNLDKKSKLRSFFEKSKKYLCIPFYPDNDQTLIKLAFSIINEKKISISPANISLIVSKCSGDRENLLNELKKIEYFCKNGKKINSENLVKLVNLYENYSISELIDNCLAKNHKKIVGILNENNFTNDDCILITRVFLNKSKKILKLSNDYKKNKNMELTISSAKPPIFWKDKEITKQHLYKWSPKKVKNLIYELNTIEVEIKKNIDNSINIIKDFILEQSSNHTNN